jgi:dienelactone hydrolase
MIVICPQSERGFRRPHTTNEIIDYMVANYRIDTKRIYLTGLSAGANSVFTYLTHKQQYASRIAGAVPMSSTFVDSAHRANFHFINQANVHMLVYCGVRDSTYLKANKRYVDTINAVTPGLAEFETYNGAHGSWNHLYNPTQRDNRVNMYEWLLQFSK